MPNFDQTGPQGQGPKTGRGMGKCGNKNTTPSRPQSQRRGQGTERGNEQGPRQRDTSCQKRANQ